MLFTNNNISSTTNNLILDHLFYQSIQSRIQKALSYEEEEEENYQAETDNNNVIESVVEGILSSRNNKKLIRDNKEDAKFEQRLNLYKLTSLAIDRRSSGTIHHVTIPNPIHINRHNNKRYNRNELLFSKPFSPRCCRRHRRPNCCSSLTLSQQPGLAEAIPAFLKTSANMLRSALENHQGVAKPLMVAGQQVMGGGMPPRWYDLFLDFLTQAAIQSYMCDGKTGLETIYDIFSYGYVEDEDEEDEEVSEEEDEEDDDNWNVKAADHHLLFPKTRTMFLFKLQVREREKEKYTLKN
ncbi:uncharacterized protein BX663DRAFT_492204 [Cokeromyces recurvatus]|uniref:uncharacterized protein n=1 Tax=Cokeromyces recurvatus TaxID=90255 RepID=UPI00221F79EC|nr:uncharacterized protein BX663DRAFT_492204 [Cokeromyces recurvatus]KAI7907849.1 hypothetical protein BX663DRAFT_492204 [Cokeromyces recurvatus]